MVVADAGRWQVALGGGQQAAVMVHDPPRGMDEARQRLGRGAVVDGDFLQRRISPADGVGQHRVDEGLAGGEVAVQGDPANPGAAGDVGKTGVGIAAEASQAGVQDGGDVALGIGAAPGLAVDDRGHVGEGTARGQWANTGPSPAGSRPAGSSQEAATATRPARMAQARKAWSNPVVAAWAAAGPSSTLAPAMVDARATPSAAPSSWAVLITRRPCRPGPGRPGPGPWWWR